MAIPSSEVRGQMILDLAEKNMEQLPEGLVLMDAIIITRATDMLNGDNYSALTVSTHTNMYTALGMLRIAEDELLGPAPCDCDDCIDDSEEGLT